jgi:hypothetical protein
MWSLLYASGNLINPMHVKSADCLKFTIRMHGHTTQIVNNVASFFLKPDSPSLAHCLILSPEQDPPNDLLLDDISLLTLLSSKSTLGRPSSPECKEIIGSVMDRRYPNLKCLLLKDTNFDEKIEIFISILQLNLELLYVWHCGFETLDPIWFIMGLSKDRICSMQAKKSQAFQFTIPINGHTTQIVINEGPF